MLTRILSAHSRCELFRFSTTGGPGTTWYERGPDYVFERMMRAVREHPTVQNEGGYIIATSRRLATPLGPINQTRYSRFDI